MKTIDSKKSKQEISNAEHEYMNTLPKLSTWLRQHCWGKLLKGGLTLTLLLNNRTSGVYVFYTCQLIPNRLRWKLSPM